jgi:hypothetical protein
MTAPPGTFANGGVFMPKGSHPYTGKTQAGYVGFPLERLQAPVMASLQINAVAASLPPAPGHAFGGAHGGTFHMPSGNSSCPQPHWCSPKAVNINFNFNFGHHCPPRRCCRPLGCRPRTGQLRQEGEGKPIEFTTKGGYKIKIDKTDVYVTDPTGKNTVKHCGDPHEHLNGTHIKDWKGKQRTILVGDGTKITMTADGPHGVIRKTSIYDNGQNVQINNDTNKIDHHSFNPLDTLLRDLRQSDGETSLFRTGRNGAGIYNNIYNQDESFNITSMYEKLGRTGGFANPNKVEDFYEDPRIAGT